MAKGVLHLNVEFSAVTDEEGKFGRLASLLGLADADHARGRCEHLWLACTRRGESDLPQWLVEQLLGARGPEALVAAELANWAAGRGDSSCRRLRIAGAAKHCLWLSSSKDQLKHEQRVKGGESRAKTSSRQLDGTFAPRPAEHPAPSSSSELTAKLLPEDPPPARDPAVRGPALNQQVAPPTEPPIAGDQVEASNLPQSRESSVIYRDQRPIATSKAPEDIAREARQRRRAEIWAELEAARRRAAEEFGIEARPLPAQDPGERELASLLACGDLERTSADARHAIAMAVLEARRDRSVQWLTGGIFHERTFRRLVGMTEADATRPRAGPRGGAERAPNPAIGRVEPPPPEAFRSGDQKL